MVTKANPRYSRNSLHQFVRFRNLGWDDYFSILGWSNDTIGILSCSAESFWLPRDLQKSHAKLVIPRYLRGVLCTPAKQRLQWGTTKLHHWVTVAKGDIGVSAQKQKSSEGKAKDTLYCVNSFIELCCAFSACENLVTLGNFHCL